MSDKPDSEEELPLSEPESQDISSAGSDAGRDYDHDYGHDYDHDHGLDDDDVARVSAEAGMSFLEHLEDFRWTVGRSLIAFIIGVLLVVFFIDDIATYLKMPIIKAYGSVDLVEENLKTYRPMGVISVFIQIAFLGGLTLSMPFVMYFLTCFVAPGLTEKERKVLRPSCVAAFLLFLSGVAFSFYLILPLTMSFFVRLNLYFGFDLFWAASEYYSMVVWFSLATGAFFQFPLVVVLLVYLQVISVEKLKSIRRAMFVGLMVFAALLTPGGDFISLPLTTGFMYGLYELAIWVGARIEKKKREAALEDEHGL
jgi:sec-independent protein translocase protein TatC